MAHAFDRYLSILGHDMVRDHGLGEKPAWVISRSGQEILWSNASGLNFLDIKSLDALQRYRFGATSPVARRLADLAVRKGGFQGGLERFRFFVGVRTKPAACLCQPIMLPDGDNGILAIAVDAPAARSGTSSPAALLKILDRAGLAAGILDASGEISSSTATFQADYEGNSSNDFDMSQDGSLITLQSPDTDEVLIVVKSELSAANDLADAVIPQEVLPQEVISQEEASQPEVAPSPAEVDQGQDANADAEAFDDFEETNVVPGTDIETDTGTDAGQDSPESAIGSYATETSGSPETPASAELGDIDTAQSASDAEVSDDSASLADPIPEAETSAPTVIEAAADQDIIDDNLQDTIETDAVRFVQNHQKPPGPVDSAITRALALARAALVESEAKPSPSPSEPVETDQQSNEPDNSDQFEDAVTEDETDREATPSGEQIFAASDDASSDADEDNAQANTNTIGEPASHTDEPEQEGTSETVAGPQTLEADEPDASKDVAAPGTIGDAISRLSVPLLDADAKPDVRLVQDNSIDTQGDVSDEDAAAPVPPSEPEFDPGPPETAFDFQPRRAPHRFVWEMDADRRFSRITPDLADAIGPNITDLVGKTWPQVAQDLGLNNPAITAAIEAGETWTGMRVDWPVEATDKMVPIELTALPIYDQARKFAGYRGFGVCRTDQVRPDPAARGRKHALGLAKAQIAREFSPPETIVTPLKDQDEDEPDHAGTPDGMISVDRSLFETPPLPEETRSRRSDTDAVPVHQETAAPSEVKKTNVDTQSVSNGVESSPKKGLIAGLAGAALTALGLSNARQKAPTEQQTASKDALLPQSVPDTETNLVADVAATADESTEDRDPEHGEPQESVDDSLETKDLGPETADLSLETMDLGDETLDDAISESLSDSETRAPDLPAIDSAALMDLFVESRASENERAAFFVPDIPMMDGIIDIISDTSEPSDIDDPSAADEPSSSDTADGVDDGLAIDQPEPGADHEKASEHEASSDADDTRSGTTDEEISGQSQETGQPEESSQSEKPGESDKDESVSSLSAGATVTQLPRFPGSPRDRNETKSNVVSMVPGSGPEFDEKLQRLSRPEREAFQQIAKALGARLEGDDEKMPETRELPGGPKIEVVDPDRPVVSLPSAFATGRRDVPEGVLLDRLPTGVLLCRGTDVLFANRAALDLLEYGSSLDLRNAGGLDAIFAEDYSAKNRRPKEDDDSDQSNRPIIIQTQTGTTISLCARLYSVPWANDRALMIVFEDAAANDTAAALPTVAAQIDRSQSELEQRFNSAEMATHRERIDELESILDTATDGVLVMEADGTIQAANRSAEALFAADQSDIIGANLTKYLAPESHRSALDYIDGLARNGVESVLNDGREVIGMESSGGLIPMFMTIGRVNRSDNSAKFCAVLRDITQWKKAEEDLTSARRQAETASSQKSDFLAKISHEIRTPLNAIIGFSEVMLGERLGPIGTERYKEYLHDIRWSGDYIMSLINDLLDLSKIEAGKMDLTFEAVSVNDILHNSVALLQPEANRERIIIRTSLSESVPNVVADARSVQQIVLNLLSNAIKFNKRGGQVIVSSVYSEDGDVNIRVRDTGIGMSDEDLRLALEPFRQVQTTRTNGGGTGLGLPLTKALVEANRASFIIDSKPQEGTMVEITFPAPRVLAE